MCTLVKVVTISALIILVPTITFSESDSCFIDGIWYGAGETDPCNCNICDPDVNRHAWTPRTGVCKIYGLCYDHGTIHPEGCAECDTSESTVAWSVQPGKCLINGICFDSGDEHDTRCGICNPDSSQTSWTVIPGKCLINDHCFSQGKIHPAGCAECDPSVSQTFWTPIPGCQNIILAALKEGHDGNLMGMDAADCLCAKQATEAGEPGIWKAFLSSSMRDVRNLIPRHRASGIWVENLQGWWLYGNWTDIFEQNHWSTGAYLYDFAWQSVDMWHHTDPERQGARGWHGSYPDGTFKPGCDCQGWTSNNNLDIGANGDLDGIVWLGDYTISCEKTLAIVCVQVLPYCECPGQGDADNSGMIDAADVMVLINYALRGGMEPQIDPFCLAVNRGDFNCDGRANLIDIVMMINFVYLNSPAGPCDPCGL